MTKVSGEGYTRMSGTFRASGEWSTDMDSRSAVKIGLWMLLQGVWGILRRKPAVRISVDWVGARPR